MSSDTAQLAQAREVIAGGHPGSGSSNAVYAAYVAVMCALAYGVPASQALFRFIDPRWMADHLTGAAGLGAVAAAGAALVLLAFRAGGIRGPVVPDLPYLDHVATSPLDRAVVLARWWHLGLFGCLFAGLLSGAVIGAGMAVAKVVDPLSAVLAALGGIVAGLLLAGTWLLGEVRTWPTGDRGPATFLRGRRSLRALHLSCLRAQAARSVTVGGAVLAGDLRAARLDIAAPATRARRARLRPRGPVAVLVARDVLGLRRAPGSLLAGMAVSALGTYAVAHASRSGVPSIVAFAGVTACYVGFGAWAEGLRLQSDNAGTPPLIGLTFRDEALAHLVVPAVLYAVVSVLVGAATAATGGGVVAAWWPLAMTGLLAAAQLMAAFRGLPPSALFSPRGAVATILLWYARPLIVVAVGGTLASALVSRGGIVTGVFVLGAVSYGSVLFGLRRVRVLGDAHRE